MNAFRGRPRLKWAVFLSTFFKKCSFSEKVLIFAQKVLIFWKKCSFSEKSAHFLKKVLIFWKKVLIFWKKCSFSEKSVHFRSKSVHFLKKSVHFLFICSFFIKRRNWLPPSDRIGDQLSWFWPWTSIRKLPGSILDVVTFSKSDNVENRICIR